MHAKSAVHKQTDLCTSIRSSINLPLADLKYVGLSIGKRQTANHQPNILVASGLLPHTHVARSESIGRVKKLG